MACGTPVVASNRAALRETASPAALLVDPDDGSAFADALLRLATDEPFREGMAIDAIAHAASFSWDRTAALTDAAIEPLLRPTSPSD
jgi:glycosyltransferase involved in cell wall biosynthesis